MKNDSICLASGGNARDKIKYKSHQRICKYPKCQTKLNRYNFNSCCFIHTVKYADLLDKKIKELTHQYRRCITKKKSEFLRNRISSLRKEFAKRY